MSSEADNTCTTAIKNFEQQLRKHFGKDFTLIEYKVERLIPLGENFASIIMKIDVKARRTRDSDVVEDMYFVGKTMVPGSVMNKKHDFSIALNNEAVVYMEVIPVYAKMERECGFAEKECIANFVPQMYGYRLSLDPRATKSDQDAILLLENLKVQDYYVMDKKVGLDLEHAMCTVKALARFHALGVALRRKTPAKFEAIKNKFENNFDFDVLNFMYNQCLDHMQQEPRFANYLDRVTAIIDRQRESLLFDQRTHEFWATIVHHDFWTTNIMFHRDDVGRPDAIKLIDFQTSTVADLYVDLTYFLFTSLDEKTMDKHFDALIAVYYDLFEFILKRLGVDVSGYSKKAFDERYMQVANYDLPRVIIAMMFFTADMGSVQDQGDVMSAVMNWKGSEKFVQKMLKVLRIFDERGWLH